MFSFSLLLQRSLDRVPNGLSEAVAIGQPLPKPRNGLSLAPLRLLGGFLEMSGRLETRLRLHGLILSPMRSMALASALSDSLFLISTSAYFSPKAFTSARCAAEQALMCC